MDLILFLQNYFKGGNMKIYKLIGIVFFIIFCAIISCVKFPTEADRTNIKDPKSPDYDESVATNTSDTPTSTSTINPTSTPTLVD